MIGGILAAVLILLSSSPAHARPDHPVINELLYDGPGADADDVFTELVGPPGWSLEAWALVGVNGDDGRIYRRVDLSGYVIPADGVLLLTTADALPDLAAVRDGVASVDWQNGPDAVQLRDGNDQVVDALQYGQAAHPGGEGSPAPQTPAGASLTRDSSSTDTQDNAADFGVADPPTPGATGAGSPPDQEPGPLELSLTIPDTSAAPGDTVLVPVAFIAAASSAVLAVDAQVTYDRAVLRIIDAALGTDAANSGWSLAHQTFPGGDSGPDTLDLSLATATDTLVGTGDLLALTVVAADTADYAWSALDLHILAVNADTAAGTGLGGRLSLRGADAAVGARLTRTDTLQVSILDADADRQAAAVDLIPFILDGGTCQDTLTANESGAHTGAFQAAVFILRGTAVCGNGVIEAPPDSILTVRYLDRLTADGPGIWRRDSLVVRRRSTVRIQSSRLVQPGDTLRVQLHDAESNVRPGMPDTVWLRVVNRATQEAERVPVVEIQPDDSLFTAIIPTTETPNAPGNGLLGVAPGDTLTMDLLDSTRADSHSQARCLGVRRFGDVDGNGLLQAYDASRVLAHVLDPYLTPEDSLAANVDSLAPDGAVTPYDAALILQRRVRLRRCFPVQTAASRNQPWWEPAGKALIIHSPLAVRYQADKLTLHMADRRGFIAGEIFLEGIHGRAQLPADLQGFLLAVRQNEHGMRVVLAGPTPVRGPGDVLAVYPDRPLQGVPRIAGSLDDGSIQLDGVHGDVQTIPIFSALLANHPNPFNPATQIEFSLASGSQVMLTVVDILGRRVRTLSYGYRTAGFHVIGWDGRDDTGATVGSGVYFCHLQSGRRQWFRPMLLLR